MAEGATALLAISRHVPAQWQANNSDNNNESVRWSLVPVASKLVYVRCGGERGSGPKGADDLCCARI